MMASWLAIHPIPASLAQPAPASHSAQPALPSPARVAQPGWPSHLCPAKPNQESFPSHPLTSPFLYILIYPPTSSYIVVITAIVNYIGAMAIMVLIAMH